MIVGEQAVLTCSVKYGCPHHTYLTPEQIPHISGWIEDTEHEGDVTHTRGSGSYYMVTYVSKKRKEEIYIYPVCEQGSV